MNKKQQRRRALVRAAFVGFELRPLNERIELLEAAGEILTGKEAEDAQYSAYTLRQSEATQLQLFKSLKG